MKYFVDIECNQYTDDIISIAVENEVYESFHSLIKPTTRITRFIEELTSITNAEAFIAPTIGTVLVKLTQWLGSLDDSDIFYFYGKEDEIVLKKTIHKLTNSSGVTVLTHILDHISDYSLEAKAHFGVTKPIALIKIVEYYRQERTIQTHSALEDAHYLHYIYNCISEDNAPNKEVFAEYSTENSSNNVVRETEDGEVIEIYENMAEALDWIAKEAHRTGKKNLDRQAVRAKLARAIKFHTKYYGYFWGKIGKHLEHMDYFSSVEKYS